MTEGYYSFQETMKKLMLTAEQIEALIREARIREFRIEGERQFKASEIDGLAAEINPSFGDSSDASDSGTGSGSGIELLPADTSDGSSDKPGQQAPGAGPPTAKTTPAGVNVFDEDELAGLDVDPMAKTQISRSVSDEISSEGGGSGSGLLDLSKESDDTSLGGVLDEIYSGEETIAETGAPAAEPGAEGEGFAEMAEPSPGPAPRVVSLTATDPLAGMFTGLMVAALMTLGFAGFVLAGLTVGVLPRFVGVLSANMIYPVIGMVVITLAALVIGLVIGKQGQ